MPTDFPKGWLTFGHDGPSRLLLNTLRARRLSHACLITGPEQSGRRTLALDLARAVNCQPQPALLAAAAGASGSTTERPCGGCAQCSRITRGLHADIRVINVETPIEAEKPAASADGSQGARHKNIRIEHIRDLERQASLKPFEGASRVFIIDGAELMTEQAANALLKTLEEPPADVLILLVASSPDALPETIVSRCHAIGLRPVAASVIEQALISRHNAPPGQARLLARLAAGGPGWAINALADPSALDRHTQAMQRISAALTGGLEARFRYARELGDAFWRKRDDTLREMDLWLEWWRDAALARAGLAEYVTNVDRLPELEAIGRTLDGDAISAGATAVAATKRALEANANARLALEVLMLDLPAVDPAVLPAARPAPAGAAP